MSPVRSPSAGEGLRAPRASQAAPGGARPIRCRACEAREKAREWFALFPKAAYMTEIESWRELADGRIEFTMRRLPSAD